MPSVVIQKPPKVEEVRTDGLIDKVSETVFVNWEGYCRSHPVDRGRKLVTAGEVIARSKNFVRTCRNELWLGQTLGS